MDTSAHDYSARRLDSPVGSSVRERDLPAHVVIYSVIALALYMRSSYREVLPCLLEGVRWLLVSLDGSALDAADTGSTCGV